MINRTAVANAKIYPSIRPTTITLYMCVCVCVEQIEEPFGVFVTSLSEFWQRLLDWWKWVWSSAALSLSNLLGGGECRGAQRSSKLGTLPWVNKALV